MTISIKEALEQAFKATTEAIDQDDKCWGGLVSTLKLFHTRTVANSHDLTSLTKLKGRSRHLERAYLNKAIEALDETSV